MPCVLLCLQSGSATHSSTAAKLQRLQGTWEGFRAGNEHQGKITLTITGNSLHFYRQTNFWFETTFNCRQAQTHSSYTPPSNGVRHHRRVSRRSAGGGIPS